jgi:hypothetical protein
MRQICVLGDGGHGASRSLGPMVNATTVLPRLPTFAASRFGTCRKQAGRCANPVPRQDLDPARNFIVQYRPRAERIRRRRRKGGLEQGGDERPRQQGKLPQCIQFGHVACDDGRPFSCCRNLITQARSPSGKKGGRNALWAGRCYAERVCLRAMGRCQSRRK